MNRNFVNQIISAALLGAVCLFIPFVPSIAQNKLKAPKGVSQSDFEKAFSIAQASQIVNQAIYEQVRPSVVQVIAQTQKGQTSFFDDPFSQNQWQRQPPSLGSGFIIDESGTIVTNRHVIGNAKEVTVKLADGRQIKGIVRGSDEMTDIAVVEIKGVQGLHMVDLGDSDKIKVGDLVCAVGNPFGLDGTFTTGVVSAVGRAGLDRSGLKFIQTDASINPGNSGGPLLNIDGEVIGINRMIVSPSGSSAGIGFSIPINEVKAVIEEIRSNGTVIRPFLGVGVATLPDELKKSAGGFGLFVTSVQSGTGAWKAGLEPNDIILRIDGKDLKLPEELVNYVLKRKVGDRVILEVLRGKERQKLSVELGKR